MSFLVPPLFTLRVKGAVTLAITLVAICWIRTNVREKITYHTVYFL